MSSRMPVERAAACVSRGYFGDLLLAQVEQQRESLHVDSCWLAGRGGQVERGLGYVFQVDRSLQVRGQRARDCVGPERLGVREVRLSLEQFEVSGDPDAQVGLFVLLEAVERADVVGDDW